MSVSTVSCDAELIEAVVVDRSSSISMYFGD